MKKSIRSLFALLLALVMTLCVTACGSQNATATTNSPTTTAVTTAADKLWSQAAYTQDTNLGNGAKTVAVQVKVNDHSITFTVKTDKDTLGDALLEHQLIAGEKGSYGLYVKEVNGITADYDTDKAYWAVSQDGKYLSTGVDTTKIAGGEHFELTYTK